MQRGRMDAVGKRFIFTTGTLTFSGSLVPIVDFAATTQTSDAVVTLNVTGPATDPQISLTSSPSMPEEEILSRLLFNQGVGTLSAAAGHSAGRCRWATDRRERRRNRVAHPQRHRT